VLDGSKSRARREQDAGKNSGGTFSGPYGGRWTGERRTTEGKKVISKNKKEGGKKENLGEKEKGRRAKKRPTRM